MWYQQTLTLGPKSRGFHLVTDEILGQIRGLSGVKVGLLHLLLQHTSASLTLNEKCDPTVRYDMEQYFLNAVPDNAPVQTASLEIDFSKTKPGDAKAGEAKASTCAACHGADGNSPTPAFPRIAGQHPDYLLQALFDYKAGKRKNPIMAAQVEALSKQDMSDLAAWFGAQQGLYVKR